MVQELEEDPLIQQELWGLSAKLLEICAMSHEQRARRHVPLQLDEDAVPPQLSPEELGTQVSSSVLEETQIYEVLQVAQEEEAHMQLGPHGMLGYRGLDICDPELSMVMQGARIPEDHLVQTMKDGKVHFASGNSDSGSIRDYSSGPGKVRWSKREPYCYRREMGASDLCYRRRMKLLFQDGNLS